MGVREWHLPEGDVLEIHLQDGEERCTLCGRWTPLRWGVPCYNGDVVSNDFPDDLWRDGPGGGGSQPVCEACYEKHARGEVPTFDRFYVAGLGPYGRDGAGI